jgi:PleD family two-component response regulator
MHEIPPLVLIASRDEWTSRSLESVLTPEGFASARAYDTHQLVDRARTIRPDAILLFNDLPDERGPSACRRLRREGAVSPSTAIVLLTPEPLDRSARLEALDAGAWELLPFPTDPAELCARLRTYVEAKLDADAARDAADVDARTGVYTQAGLVRRSGELAAFARRMEQPLACVVFEAAGASGEATPTPEPDLGRVAARFRDVGRRSDVIGRVDERRLAVVATDTDEAGARGLARRLSAALDPSQAATIRSGCWAVADAASLPADPREMIRRAGAAAGA